jgi:Sec-independent protein translocase protein TatA
MLTFSPIKLSLVLLVALILLGPDKLPHAARKVAQGWRTFHRVRERIERELRESVPDLPSTDEIVRMARSPVHFLNRLADLPSNTVRQLERDLTRRANEGGGPPSAERDGSSPPESGDGATWQSEVGGSPTLSVDHGVAVPVRRVTPPRAPALARPRPGIPASPAAPLELGGTAPSGGQPEMN